MSATVAMRRAADEGSELFLSWPRLGSRNGRFSQIGWDVVEARLAFSTPVTPTAEQ
jgi:hypothetical protein